MIASLESGTNKNEESRFSDWSVQAHSNVGVARGLNTITTEQYDTVKLRFTDVSLKRDGNWRAIDAQETIVR